MLTKLATFIYGPFCLIVPWHSAALALLPRSAPPQPQGRHRFPLRLHLLQERHHGSTEIIAYAN